MKVNLKAISEILGTKNFVVASKEIVEIALENYFCNRDKSEYLWGMLGKDIVIYRVTPADSPYFESSQEYAYYVAVNYD